MTPPHGQEAVDDLFFEALLRIAHVLGATELWVLPSNGYVYMRKEPDGRAYVLQWTRAHELSVRT